MMDPDVAVREWLDAVAAGDVEKMKEVNAAIVSWLGRGGFRPPKQVQAEIDAIQELLKPIG